MPELHTYRIFISHAWSYNAEYYRLIKYLDAATNFKYANYSVPEHEPAESNLSEKLGNQIRPVQIVLVLAGMYVNHSDWIQFEMDFAKNIGKPIAGLKPWGAGRIPLEVQNTAVEIIGWNTSSIVDAILRSA